MARAFVKASAQYLDRSGAIVSSLPFTVAAIATRSADDSIISSLAWQGSSSTSFFDLEINSDGRCRFRVNDGSGETSAFSASGTSERDVGVWAHYCAVVASASSRAVYVDGDSKATQSSSKNPTLSNSAIGRQVGTTSRDASANIMRVTYWSVALSDDEVARLGKKIDPWMIRPDAIISDTILTGRRSQEIDQVTGIAWTHNNSPAYAVDDRMILKPAGKSFFAPVGAPPPSYIAAISNHLRKANQVCF